MKNRGSRDEGNSENIIGPESMTMNKKNKKRLGGGGGLSLEAFANAKSNNRQYNPALIKKKREFYKNAKHVSKFKKSIKQQKQQNDLPHAIISPLEGENKAGDKTEINDRKKNKGSYSLRALYEKKHEEDEKARVERESIIQAKKEQREITKAQRKAAKEKLLKKTQYGQPVMKYRIEHLLQSIQGSTEKSDANTLTSRQCVSYSRRKHA